jgi:thymidylate kinase
VEESVHKIESLKESEGELIREELEAGISRTSIKEQDEWFRTFAKLWFSSRKNNDLNFKDKAEGQFFEDLEKNYSVEIFSALEKGKVVIADIGLQALEMEKASVRPDDTLVFDIDPEMAIKLWSASRGVVL